MPDLPTDHEMLLQASYVDASGKGAPIEEATQWSISDDTLLTLEISTENSTVSRVRPKGPLGDVTVTATGGALTATYDVKIIDPIVVTPPTPEPATTATINCIGIRTPPVVPMKGFANA